MARKRKKKVEDNYYYCAECNESLHEREFYSIQGKYNQRDNQLTICKNCMKNISYYNPDKRERVMVKNFQSVLMKLDLPFMAGIFRSALEYNGDTVGRYINILQLPQYKSKLTWAHSHFTDDEDDNEKYKKEFISEHELMKMVDDENRIEIIPGYYEFVDVLRDKWGMKYETQDLLIHEKLFLKLKNSVIIDNEIDEINLIDYCKAKVLYDEAMFAGESAGNIDKFRKNKDGLFKGLKTIDGSSGDNSLAMLFKQIDEMEGGLEILEDYRKYPRDQIDMLAYLIVLKNKEHHGISTDDFTPEDMYTIYDRRAKEYRERLEQEGKETLLDSLSV